MSRRELEVICHSGYTYAEEPRAFILDGCRHAVERIVARWRMPNGPAFRILSDLGPAVLSYDERNDRWEIAPETEHQSSTDIH